jgi:uncharacterized protein (TIGR00255 family)
VLLSMTGIGEARVAQEQLSVSVELRSVNNRHLKVSVRGPDAYLSLESEIEKRIRSRVARGTVSVQLRVDRHDSHSAYTIDHATLRDYWAHVRKVADEMHLPPPSDLSALLPLPGVIVESHAALLDPSEWPAVQQALDAAIDRLNEFRAREGASMATELSQLCTQIESSSEQIAARAPKVVEEYRRRLQERVTEWLREAGAALSPGDLIREVGLFADRSDINEELTRLRSHLEQFRSLIEGDESAGRTMEFLCQELNREINTIGSKANDVDIARRVVDTKAAIERIREIVQNVE